MKGVTTQAGQRILALVPEPDRVARLRAAFGDDCRVLNTEPELIAASRDHCIELVIVSALDRERRGVATAVAAIRASRRSPPVHVYADRSIECVRELMCLARAGARGLIMAGVDDDPVRLRRLLDGPTLEQAIEAVRIAVHDAVLPRHVPLVVRSLEHIVDPIRARALARSLGVSRRTMTAWARHAGARGIRSLTSRCRVLVAMEMLRDPRRSVEQVAHQLRFSSSAHLHNTIRRYTGLRPRETTSRRAAEWCAVLFAPARAAQRPPEEKRPPPAEWPQSPNAATLRPDQAQPGEGER